MASGDAHLADAPSLRALILFAAPDGLVVKSWSAEPTSDAEVELGAARLAALLQAARPAAQALLQRAELERLTLEASQGTAVVTPVSDELAVALLFDPEAALGMVRVQSNAIVEKIRRTVAATGAQRAAPPRRRRPRASRLLEIWLHRADDEAAALHRLAEASGLSATRLREPDGLGPEELARLEAALERLEP